MASTAIVDLSRTSPDVGPGRPDLEAVPQPVRIERYTAIDEVPLPVWDALAPKGAVGLESAHLRAVEVSRINDLRPYYLIGYLGREAVGIAYCFAIDMDLSTLGSDVKPDVLATVKAWNPKFMDLRLVEVGFASALGSAIAARDGQLDPFLCALAAEVDAIGELEGADLALVRDVALSRYGELRRLESFGYSPCLGFPIARMPLVWPDFAAYLAALKGDKRSNIRRKRARLNAPEIQVEIIEDYEPIAARLAELWENVSRRKSDYEHEHLTEAYFAAMARHFRGKSHVIAIRREGEIVAFALSLIGEEEYFWAYVGIDYEHRDAYELYFNLVFAGIEAGIASGRKTLNLGITTYDFKTFVGAELEPMVYLVKSFARPELSPAFADLFGTGIVQPETPYSVFKQPICERGITPRAAPEFLRGFLDARDPFLKLERYVRTDILKAVGVYAFFPPFSSAQEPLLDYMGREIVMLGTNSYLGLATHPKVKAAAREAIDRYGTGCSGSPLLNGTLELHQELARSLAEFMGAEDAIVFSTGYQTNLGVVSALVGEGDVLVMDERNHASLIDGARLSRATVLRFRHGDPESLEAALVKAGAKPKLVVTDSLFSMEGTVVDLPSVVRLCKRFGARLMLDESHAIGVMGPGGRGVAEQFGLASEVDVVMGTFSKSFASVGGFVAARRKIVDSLKHNARSHIFSASLPPASAAAVLAAVEVVRTEPERRARLLDNARYLAQGLARLGYDVRHHGSAIVPLQVDDELLTMAFFHRLFEEGVFVNPVIYPAVPKGGELIRISLMATFDRPTLDRALAAFARVRTPNWPKPLA